MMLIGVIFIIISVVLEIKLGAVWYTKVSANRR
jgi:hypothetical protein